ncbi:hypothetical protein Hanom_Chr06g00506461 [Helianthus anomalus]
MTENRPTENRQTRNNCSHIKQHNQSKNPRHQQKPYNKRYRATQHQRQRYT